MMDRHDALGSPDARPRRRPRWAAARTVVPTWLAAVLVGSGLGLGLRLLLFLAGTLAVDVAAELAERALGLVPSVDPVYTRAALRTLTDIRVEGLAVSGPLGDALRAAAPGLLKDSARAGTALVRLAVEPGSAVLARLVVAAAAHAGVLAVGLWMARAGLRRRRPALVLAGVAVQAQVGLSVLATPPTLEDLEATGLSFAVNALLPGLVGRRVAVSDLLAGAPAPLVAAGLAALALAIAYAAAGLLMAAVAAGRGGLRRSAPGWRARLGRPQPGLARLATPALGLVLATATLVAAAPPAPPPRTDPLAGLPEVVPTAAAAPTAAAVAAAPSGPPLRDTWAQDRLARQVERRAGRGSQVAVRGGHNRFAYLVDGRPQVIRGMGLNTQYRRLLGPGERAARLDRDLAMLQRLGVNTVLGWDPGEFDITLLDLAARHDIGVVLPFELDPAADYADPAVRSELTARVLAWVEQYRQHPALRMWGLGNEVLHKIVHPAWMGPQDPAGEARARAFASWLVETADAVHALDPQHPVTYRDAEDAFISWVAEALARGGAARPWFVWGANAYTPYLDSIARRWPERGMNVALWISEFAPAGLAMPDRPRGFRELWGYVRQYPDWVLGGAAYAWTRNGPEEIDRSLGLTDDGHPADGRSLRALAELFRQGEGLTGDLQPAGGFSAQ